ncbi:ABC transporter substrate-binding protein [Anaerotalea alkaliphila]|uniref:ABC transporter substrate-binding protein n=1 Tax=Anaerotalea alkaliphila TaxID=2662126 RepID=A0A7X5HTA2_9FIRM|nr:ABC transporter substrate-binding protein [Anaerotalea alkaliphila]NDL66267.1 ABC transporter substrate-binding protein [Anaerotalea alkaliphila]
MKKTTTLVLALVMAASLVLTGCGKTEQPAEGGSAGSETGGSQGGTIKIGVLTPKTGDLAQYGMAVENAAKLAVKEANDAGGINGMTVELVIYDNEGDATKSVNLFNRLIENDKIDALLGPVISGTSLAVAPLADEAGIPMITPTGTNEDITPDYPYVFRACYIDPYQGQIMGKFASENISAKTAVVMVNVGSDYSVGLGKNFKVSFEEKGGSVLAEENYTDSDTDFKAILTNIKAKNPDVVYIGDYYNAVGNILSQAKEIGLDAQFLGSDGWDGVQVDYIDVAEGGFFTNHYSTKDTDPVVQNFIKNYTDTYNETPNALAALGYDGALILMDAFRNAGSTDKEAVLEAIRTTDLNGVTGHITFDELGNPIKDISIIKIQDGDMVLETKLSE